jgi:hypothetical protein
MLKLYALICLLAPALPAVAGDVGFLNIKGPTKDRALIYAYGKSVADYTLMDLNGKMAWETSFDGFTGGDGVKYGMMLSTETNGKFDSFTYVQVSPAVCDDQSEERLARSDGD